MINYRNALGLATLSLAISVTSAYSAPQIKTNNTAARQTVGSCNSLIGNTTWNTTYYFTPNGTGTGTCCSISINSIDGGPSPLDCMPAPVHLETCEQALAGVCREGVDVSLAPASMIQ